MIGETQGSVWIGTSNIVLAGNKSTFPLEFRDKSRLNYYSTLFNSIELNNTFHKVPVSSTFEKWSRDVTDDFRFTIKLWKGITHIKDLKFNEEDIHVFLKNAQIPLEKKGCLLVQFPGKITTQYFNEVERILHVISSSEFAYGWQKAIEFRDSSWHIGETAELLNEFNASMVLHDFPKGKNDELNKKMKTVYLRFHGPKGDYRGSYSYEFLNEKAEQIKEWGNSGKLVYAYFNNTAGHGDAYQNAHTLKKLLDFRPMNKKSG